MGENVYLRTKNDDLENHQLITPASDSHQIVGGWRMKEKKKKPTFFSRDAPISRTPQEFHSSLISRHNLLVRPHQMYAF